MRPQPGEFRERIILQSKQVTRNGIGEEVVTWIDAVTNTSDHGLWASVRPLRGREFYTANQMQQAVDIRVFIRARSGVTPDMRFTWNGEPYDITGIIPGTGPYLGTLEIMAVNGIRNGR